MDWEMTAQVAEMWSRVSNQTKATEYAQKALELADKAIANGQIQKEMEFYELLGRYRYIYTVMADMAYIMKNYQLANSKISEQIQRVKQILSMAENDAEYAGYQQYLTDNLNQLEYKLLTLQMEEAEQKNGKKGKIDFIKNTITRLQSSSNPDSVMLSRQLEMLLNDISGQADTAKK
jgi:hypothetical protein